MGKNLEEFFRVPILNDSSAKIVEPIATADVFASI